VGPGAVDARRRSASIGLPPPVVLLVGLAAAVIVAIGVRALAWLVAPVALALVVVITVRPVYGWLHRRGLPRWAAGIVLVVLVYAVVVVLAGGIVASIARLLTLLPTYRDEAGVLLGSVFALARQYGIGPVPLAELASSLDLGRLVGVLGAVLSGVVGLSGNVVFLLSVMLFLTIESGGFRAKLAVLAAARPDTAAALEARRDRDAALPRRDDVFGLLTAIVDTVALLALRVPLAVLWGLLAFITNYIPYVGFFIGIVPPRCWRCSRAGGRACCSS
jgi:predicted PurR-regulated permease PerM